MADVTKIETSKNPAETVPAAASPLTPTKKFLTAEEIFAADDRDYSDVEVPEWGGWLRLRSLSAEEALKFMGDLQNPVTKNQGMVRIIQLCASNEKGELVFNNTHLNGMKQKNIKVYKRLQDEAMKLIGFTDDVPLEVVCTHEGCTFKTTTLLQAQQHADATQHDLTVSGSILSQEKRKTGVEAVRKNDSSAAATGASPTDWR